MEDHEVWRLDLDLLPRNPHGKAGNEERRRTKDMIFKSMYKSVHLHFWRR